MEMGVMYTRRILFITISSCFGVLAQEAPAIRIGGAVKEPLSLTAADLAKLPWARVNTKGDGIAVTYEGVWLHEVSKKAGAPGGTELRGKAMASYVVAEAKDGYQVVFSLAEIDPMFTNNEILLADRADGKPLIGRQGPFRLVAPKEKRGARSIRMLTKLDVVMLRK
jgi:DMSO/TMAO reductase YedYZ molybdopterin-dependent catalytic subunit